MSFFYLQTHGIKRNVSPKSSFVARSCELLVPKLQLMNDPLGDADRVLLKTT